MRVIAGARRDLRDAVRRLWRHPGSSIVAAATLAIGTAAAAGAFGVLAGVLLRDLPYPGADRLALVWRTNDASASPRLPLSPPDFVAIRDRAATFAAVAALNSFTSTWQDADGEPRQIELGVVSGDFFRVMGVPAALGRTLEPDDDRPAAPGGPAGVAPLVLDHGFWLEHFGGDRGAIGRSIPVGAELMTVVGVMPPDFRLHLPAGAGMSTRLAGWTPLRIDYAAAPRDGAYLKVIGRLDEGVEPEAAGAELATLAASLRAEFPLHEGEGTALRVAPLREEVVAHVRWAMVLLAAAGALVLLVACGNVAALLLVRFLAREGELGMRLALGAGHGSLLRQLLMETLALATAGGVLGGALVATLAPSILRLQPDLLPRIGESTLDPAAYVVIPVVILLATLLGGVGPALVAARSATAAVVRGAREPGLRVARARRVVVVAQLAFGFAVLYGGAALATEALRVHREHPGFVPEGAVTFRVTLPFARYRGEEVWTEAHRRIQERLADVPGVAAVGATSDLPLTGSNSLDPFALEPGVEDRPWGSRHALYRIITPGYLRAAGIRLREGRGFEPGDRAGGPLVAVVDRALAARIAGTRPGPVVGRSIDVTLHRFRDGYRVERTPARIIGVVDDVPHQHPRAEPGGTIYLVLGQQAFWAMGYVVRGSDDALPSLASLRAAVAEIDPALPLDSPRPLARVLAQALAMDRFLLALVLVLAAAVVALALVGLYALMAELVGQRRREYGLRLALGARPAGLARRVLRSGAVMAAAGAVAGLALVPWLERLLVRALPFHQPPPLASVALTVFLLVGGACAACAVPAVRVASTDPASVLRD